jgi:uncharacterized protein with HEPN domain
VSRSWLLYLDDLIASAEKIGRLTAGHTGPEIIWDAANRHVPALLDHALALCSTGADSKAEP